MTFLTWKIFWLSSIFPSSLKNHQWKIRRLGAFLCRVRYCLLTSGDILLSLPITWVPFPFPHPFVPPVFQREAPADSQLPTSARSRNDDVFLVIIKASSSVDESTPLTADTWIIGSVANNTISRARVGKSTVYSWIPRSERRCLSMKLFFSTRCSRTQMSQSCQLGMISFSFICFSMY